MNLNATLFAQLVVFFILGWFTMKFVWPPIIRAIDERTNKIASGLEYADKTKKKFAEKKRKLSLYPKDKLPQYVQNHESKFKDWLD